MSIQGDGMNMTFLGKLFVTVGDAVKTGLSWAWRTGFDVWKPWQQL